MSTLSRVWIRSLVLAAILTLSSGPVLAVMPDEVMSDPVLELRARNISQELRCLVCQNQSIDDSNAPLARDLRLIVRERLSVGDSDDEVLAFVAARYGSYALLKPPYSPSTALLWLGPLLVLLAGSAGVLACTRQRSTTPALVEPLSSEERHRLSTLSGEKF